MPPIHQFNLPIFDVQFGCDNVRAIPDQISIILIPVNLEISEYELFRREKPNLMLDREILVSGLMDLR